MLLTIEDELEICQRSVGACPICKKTPVIQYEPGVTFLECCPKDGRGRVLPPIVEADWNPEKVKQRWNARVLRLA